MASTSNEGDLAAGRDGGAPVRLTRRLLMVGAGAAGVTAAGLVAGRFRPEHDRTDLVGSNPLASADPGTPAPRSAASPPAATPAASPIAVTSAEPAPVLPGDLALVASPRLPLFGLGPEAVGPLLKGAITDWAALGAGLSLPIEPLGLSGSIPPGMAPERTFADYASLAAALEAKPGAFAVVPVDAVDFRVATLTVGLRDPLHDGGSRSTIRIGVVGDIVPGRNVHAHMAKYGDFTRPFRDVAALLRSFDLTVANLEGNISATLPQPTDPHAFDFVSEPAMLDGFKLAGIDGVTLANNHTVWNEQGWGVQGLLDTIDALTAAKIPFFGAGLNLDRARAPWIVEVGGVKIAWLGIDGVTANHEVTPGAENGVVDFDAAATADQPGTNPYVSSQFLDDVAAAAKRADVVIPYFHLGAEYVAIPPLWAVNGARAAIDAGATMVVTNHPHVIQGMEVYNGKPIVYSPGNFIIDQMWGVEVRSGYALDLALRDKAVVRIRCHGVEIQDFHMPRPMTAGEQANLMDRFWASTDRLAARDGR